MALSRNRQAFADEKVAACEKILSDWTGLSEEAAVLAKNTLEEAAHGLLRTSNGLAEQVKKLGEDIEANILVADDHKKSVDRDVEKYASEIMGILGQDCVEDVRLEMVCEEVAKQRQSLRDYEDWTGVKFHTAKDGKVVITTTSEKNGFSTFGGDIRTGSRFVTTRRVWKWLEKEHVSPAENNSDEEN